MGSAVSYALTNSDEKHVGGMGDLNRRLKPPVQDMVAYWTTGHSAIRLTQFIIDIFIGQSEESSFMLIPIPISF